MPIITFGNETEQKNPWDAIGRTTAPAGMEWPTASVTPAPVIRDPSTPITPIVNTGVTTPAPVVPYDPWASFNAQVSDWYRTLLGREPGQDELQIHQGNVRGPEGVRQAILVSPEYRARQAAPTPTPTAPSPDDPTQAILKAFTDRKVTPNPGEVEYWLSKINETGGWNNPGNRAYWLQRFYADQGGIGDRRELPEAGSGVNPASGTPIGTVPGIPLTDVAAQYNDPYTGLLEEFIKARLGEVNAPVADPFRDQYAQLLQSRTDALTAGTPQTQQLLDFLASRAADLQKPVQTPQELALMEALTKGISKLNEQPQETPEEAQYKAMLQSYIQEMQTPGYTGAEQEVVRTSALDPIERDRSAAKQRMLEQLGARGLNPDSGIAQEAMLRVDSTFDGLRAEAQRGIALNELQRRLQRQQSALTAGGTLAGLSQQQRDRAKQELMAILGLQGSQADLSVAQQQRQNAALDQALNLLTAGVDITDARMREALDTAGALNTLSGSVRGEEAARRNEALGLVGLLADLGPQRLQTALAALGGGEQPGSVMNSLIGLGQLNNQTNAINASRSSSFWSGLGSLAALVGNASGKTTGGGGGVNLAAMGLGKPVALDPNLNGGWG